MPRQLRSSTKPTSQTPYTKPTKVSELPASKPRHTSPSTLGPPPPPSAPPGQKKIIRAQPPSPSETALFFPSPSAFNTWLTDTIGLGRDSFAGQWLRLAKKSCPTPDLTYDQALRVALTHGWIDGQRKSLPGNDHYFIQRFTPRRKGSLWSKRNVGIVEGLIEEGEMLERGMMEVRAAKEDGRWERAYSGGKDIQVPKDFERLLKEDEEVWDKWEGLGKGGRYPVLLRLETMRSVGGREKKMKEYVRKLASGETL